MIESPRIQEHLVTPEIAKQWLVRNVSNRRVSPPLVERYARDMGAGNWELNGETVKFDSSRRLIDGQHRLSAIIKSGKSTKMYVATGLPTNHRIAATIDNGRARSASDILKMHGYSHNSIMAALARFVMQLQPDRWNGGSVGNYEILEEVKRNPSKYERASIQAKQVSGVVTAPPYGAFAMQAFDKDPELFVKWHNQFASGANLEHDSAILTLRNHLLQLKSLGLTRVTTFRYETYAKLCHAWNLGRQGKKCKRINTPSQTTGIIELL